MTIAATIVNAKMGGPAAAGMAAIDDQAKTRRGSYIRTLLGHGATRVVNALTALQARWEKASERRRVVAELSRLDDRLLADLGLTRGTIEAQVLALETSMPVYNEIHRYVGTTGDVGTVANIDRPARAA